jgi:putative NADPH-quinone reductase
MTSVSTRVLVLDGHPDGASLCSALSDAAAQAAQARGAEVRVARLSAMQFDPDLAKGYKRAMPLEPDLEALLADLRWCDTLILVHPLWWGAAPAKLKGLFDRLFLPGIAFAYEGDGHFPKKLFEGRTARVLITADTPPWYLWLGYRNGWPNVIRRQILDFVGLKVTQLKVVGPVRDATQARIAQFFAAARKLAG